MAIVADPRGGLGAGEPLPVETRATFEGRYGHDFSQVRVHSGPRDAGFASDLDARAFTVGQHIVLGSPAPARGTGAYHGLLGHELAHVVQQQRAGRVAVQCAYALYTDPEWLTSSAPVGQRVKGTAAHQEIQRDFLTKHPKPDGEKELVVPGAQAGPSRAGGDSTVIPPQEGAERPTLIGESRNATFGTGNIDIVRRSPRNGFKIADIKPAGLFGTGIDQVAGYLSQMTQSDAEMVAWRRDKGVIASQCGIMTDRMYTPQEYIRVSGRLVRVRWAVPGVVAYKEFGGEEPTFLCGVDDQGYADRLIDDVLVRARTWGGTQLDPAQQLVIQEIAGLTLETLERLLVPHFDPVTMLLLRQLVDEQVLPELRRLATQAVNLLFDRIQMILAEKIRLFLQQQIAILCATATALTAAELWRLLQKELDRMLGDAVVQGLQEAAKLVAGLAAAAVVLAVIAVIVVVALVYVAVEIIAALAAALAVLEIGTIIAGLVEAAIAFIVRYGWTVIPATQAARPLAAGQ